MNHHFPKLNLISSIENTKLNSNLPPMRMDNINADDKISSFKQTMIDMTKNLNDVANAPDKAIQDMLSGNGADIHDVITAINKAEISVNVATQITTKVIQAYEKITQIQV